jgi:hypothetical protein
VGGGGAAIFRQKLLGEDGSVRRSVVVVKEPGFFSPKFGGDIFARFHAIARKLRTRTRNSQFGLLGQVFRAITNAVYMAATARNVLDTTSYKVQFVTMELQIKYLQVMIPDRTFYLEQLLM